jgi:hypothetical protein
MSEPDAGNIFTAWILMLQVASKMPTRGVLLSKTGELDSIALQAMTRFPAKNFDRAIEFLSQPRINWVQRVSGDYQAAITQVSGDYQASDSCLPLHDMTEHDITLQDKTLAPKEVMEFPCIGRPSTWVLYQEEVDRWAAVYKFDVMAECNKAREWILASPTRHKTARGMQRFLVGWLNRANPSVSVPRGSKNSNLVDELRDMGAL